MNVTLNRDVIEGRWKQIRGQVKEQWGRLADDRLDQVSGSYEELADLVQEAYGYTTEKARQEVDEFIRRMNRSPE